MILKVTFDKKSLLFKIYNKNAIFFKFRRNYILCINFTPYLFFLPLCHRHDLSGFFLYVAEISFYLNNNNTKLWILKK